MIKNVERSIQSSNAASLLYFISKGSFLGIAAYNIFSLAKTSSYIAVIISSIIGIIPFAMLMYILKNMKGNNIIETIEIIFGSKLGKIINVLASIFFFMFAVVLLYNLISFIDINYMPETSKVYLACFFILLFSYMLSKGLAATCRASQIIVYISIIIFALTGVGLLFSVKIENLFPIFEGGTKGILSATFTCIVFSVMPCFLITLVGPNMVDDKSKYIKNCYKYYWIQSIVMFMLCFFCLTTLGINIISINKFPEYIVLTQISIFNILKRVQNLFAMSLCFNVIFLVLMCLMYSYKNIERFIKTENKKSILYFALSIISVVASLYIFPNISIANIFYVKYITYVVGGFITILMIAIFLKLIYINKKEKRAN